MKRLKIKKIYEADNLPVLQPAANGAVLQPANGTAQQSAVLQLTPANGAVQQPANNTQLQPANGTVLQPNQSANNAQQNQLQEQNPATNLLELVTKITTLQVNTITALQEVYKKVAQNIPELSEALKDTKSPIAKEAKEFIDTINGFTQGKADPAKPDTITAAMTAYGNITEKLNALVSKIREVAQQQTQQQPANGTTQQLTAQPQQQGNVNASYQYNSFGTTLNEKLRIANFNKKVLNTILSY